MASFIPKFEESEEASRDSSDSSGCLLENSQPKNNNIPSSNVPLYTRSPTVTATDCDSSYCCTLYTFSQDTLAGKCLTRLANTFLPSPQLNYTITNTNSINTDTDTVNTHIKHGAAFVAFLSLLLVTFANNMLAPMRDAAALALGVNHIPNLTLASTVLAFCSSVPMGWLFEAPDPDRKGKRWRDKVGLTRGDTQGTSLALFYRIFAILLLGYALGFQLVDYVLQSPSEDSKPQPSTLSSSSLYAHNTTIHTVHLLATQCNTQQFSFTSFSHLLSTIYCLYLHIQHNVFQRAFFQQVLSKLWAIFYIAFYLVGNLMKLYSVSLLWGVATEAMEYEEQAEIRCMNMRRKMTNSSSHTTVEGSSPLRNSTFKSQSSTNPSTTTKGKQSRTRLERLEFVGFGSTLGGILGSMFVSFTAQTLRLSGLLIIAAILLALSAELSVELGQIMLRHWEEEQRERLSNSDLQSLETTASEWMEDTILPPSYSLQSLHSSGHELTSSTSAHDLAQSITTSTHDTMDPSMKKTASFGSMKRIASNHGISQVSAPDSDCIDSSMKKAASFGSMKRIASNHGMAPLISRESDIIDSSMKKTASFGSMKRIASNHGISQVTAPDSDCIDSSMKKTASFGSMKRIASNHGMVSLIPPGGDGMDSSMKKTASFGSIKRSSNSVAMKLSDVGSSSHDSTPGDKPKTIAILTPPSRTQSTSDSTTSSDVPASSSQQNVDESLFKQRLLRGISTILRSRLLMTIFTYNALYATSNFLLSYQRAELVANRKKTSTSNGASKKVDSHAAFLAKINIVSNMAVFLLQGSGLGAWIATTLGQRGTLALMPLARVFGVAMLVLWHTKNDGSPPNLTLFLVLDELTKVINFAVAKPVRESLWHGLSNEARYEAKPIVDTMANRWGGGSAAFLMSLLGKIMDFTGIGGVSEDGSKSLFGFPPVLVLCAISAIWWTMVSLDLGAIRHRIDIELKKQQ